TVNPDTMTGGSTNVTLSWTVINAGSKPLSRVLIGNADKNTFKASNTSGFNCPNNPANSTWSAQGWKYTFVAAGHGNPEQYQFDACTTSDQIANGGGQQTFLTTFSSITSQTADWTDFGFTVTLTDTAGLTTVIGVNVTVTKYSITITASPTTIDADG